MKDVASAGSEVNTFLVTGYSPSICPYRYSYVMSVSMQLENQEVDGIETRFKMRENKFCPHVCRSYFQTREIILNYRR